MAKANRRKFLTKAPVAAAAVGAAAVAVAGEAKAAEAAAPVKKVIYPDGQKPEKPLFSGIVTFGNLVFIAGIGAHFPGDITAHTKHVLDEIEKKLTLAGSSMEK